ncbi:MAG TPA: phage tail tube protein [Vulgatibacter sp.]
MAHGRKAKLYIAKTATPAAPTLETDWLEIELATEGTFNSQRGAVEVTNRKSGADEEYIPGLRSYTYDFTALFDPADPALQAVIDNFMADEEITWFRDRPLGSGATLPQTVFRGFVTNKPVAMPGKDKTTIQATIQVSGKPTTSAQAST